MVVLVLTACPAGLRGQLTRWLMEIAPGVFVGHVSARVREQLWTRVTGLVGNGRALMVHSVRGEQRLAFQVHNYDWTPTDFDGHVLMMRPNERVNGATRAGPPPESWSIAARRRRFGREIERRRRQSSE